MRILSKKDARLRSSRTVKVDHLVLNRSLKALIHTPHSELFFRTKIPQKDIYANHATPVHREWHPASVPGGGFGIGGVLAEVNDEQMKFG